MANNTIQFPSQDPAAYGGAPLPGFNANGGTVGWGTISQPGVDYSGGFNPSANTIQAPAQSSGLSLLQTATTALPVAGSIANLLMSGYGMYLQHRAQKKQEELQEKAIDQQNYWIKVQNAIAERERGRQWAWLTDDKNYQRRIAAVNAVMAQAANNKQLLNNLVSIWGGK